MADILTSQWVDDLARRAATVEVDPDITVTIQHCVVGDTDFVWHMKLADGRVVVEPGACEGADVRLTTDHDVAIEIHSGSQSAQRAFLDGKVRIGGRIQLLFEYRAALVEVASALSGAT